MTEIQSQLLTAFLVLGCLFFIFQISRLPMYSDGGTNETKNREAE